MTNAANEELREFLLSILRARHEKIGHALNRDARISHYWLALSHPEACGNTSPEDVLRRWIVEEYENHANLMTSYLDHLQRFGTIGTKMEAMACSAEVS